MTNRRSFLQLMGLAPVAGPMAAKSAHDAAMANLTRTNLEGFIRDDGPTAPTGRPISSEEEPWHMRVLRFFKNEKMPPWYEEIVRGRYRHVSYLDPDLACKKSWSLNVRIATQRERNIKKAIENLKNEAQQSDLTQAFYKKYGWYP